MRKDILVLIVSFFLIIPNVSALEAVPGWETECTNSTHLLKSANIVFNNTLFEFNQSLICPLGCDEGKDICMKWPGEAISGEYFIMFQLLALSIFLITIWRIEIRSKEIKVFDVVAPIFGFILFVILALQGNNVIDLATGEGIPMIMVVWFDYGLSFLMLMFFFLNVFKWLKAVSEEGGKL